MAKTKKNAKIIIFSLLIGLVAVAGLASAFLLNYNTYSPSAPVVLDDGKNIYISTSLNDNYVGYRFKFVDSKTKEIFINSKNNVIDAGEFVEKGGILGETYDVSVCYLAQNAGNNSNFSASTKWLCQKYLASTMVYYNLFQNTLTWDEVENADFYRLYFNDIDDEVFFDTTECEIDLRTLRGGEKIVYVVAYSNNQNIKSGDKSNVIEFNLQHHFSGFTTNISFDTETKILTAENQELLEKIIISLDGTAYTSIKFDVRKVENSYIYKIDLTAIYNNETIIGIKPADIDEFNVYLGSEMTYGVEV